MYIHTYIYTYTQTYIHTYTSTYIHTYTQIFSNNFIPDGKLEVQEADQLIRLEKALGEMTKAERLACLKKGMGKKGT